MFSLPQYPSYYNTKPIFHYISDENKDMLYFIQNTSYINKFILEIEELFDDKDFKGFELGIINLKEDRYSIGCRAFYHSQKQDQSVEKKILEMIHILDIYDTSSLCDLEEVEIEEVCDILKNNGLSKIYNKEDRFNMYYKLVNNLKFYRSTFEDYNAFIKVLYNGDSQFENNYILINGTQQQKIAFSLSEFTQISNGIFFAQLWKYEYEGQLRLLQIIKDFDSKDCDKLLIDSFSGLPVFYAKDKKIFQFKTDDIANLPEYKISSFIEVNRKLAYEDFKNIHHISNCLYSDKFYETVTHIESEKEKVALSKIFESELNNTSHCANHRI